MYLQIILMIAVSVVLWFFPQKETLVFSMICTFFFAEFVVLETQRNENSDAVYYRKGCFFAMVDLLSVFAFIAVFGLLAYQFFTGNSVGVRYFPLLFLYIASRKFYITKNYSYEK